MRIRYSREEGIYILHKEDTVLSDGVISIDMCERRKEILFDWASEQIAVINEKKIRHPVGAFFGYKIVPTTVGTEISLICFPTEQELDLTLIDGEEF